MNFNEHLKAAIRISTPLVMVRTYDANAAVANIKDILKSSKGEDKKSLFDTTGLIQWDVCHSVRPINQPGEKALHAMLGGAQPEALAVPAELFRICEQMPQDTFLFVFNAHLFWKEKEEIQGIWNLRDVFKERGSMLILLATPGATLPIELQQDVMVIDEPLPTEAQIEKVIVKAHDAARQINKNIKAPEGEKMQKAVYALAGLPSFPAETSAQLCLDPQTGVLDTSELWDKKRQVISQTPGLTVYDGKSSLKNIGGNQNIISFYKSLMAGPEQPRVILRFDEMEKAFAGSGTDLSGNKTELTGAILTWFQDKHINGVIHLGVPGCSKSEILYAIANEYEKPVINVDLPGMQGGIIGESISNLKAAQKCIDAIGGNRVLAIATVNDVSTLPAPLLRRFNLGTFFFDAPTDDAERQDILTIHRRKYNIKASDAAPDMTAWTGSDIEQACYKAYLLGITLRDAAAYVVPVMRARANEMEALRKDASNRYISASHAGMYQYTAISASAAAAANDGPRRLKI